MRSILCHMDLVCYHVARTVVLNLEPSLVVFVGICGIYFGENSLVQSCTCDF